MAVGEIHVGDVGTELQITLKDGSVSVDVSAATLKQLTLRAPNGTELVKAMTFLTDGSDGILKYTSIAGDFSVKGIWKFQVYVELPSGSWNSDISEFRVFHNL